MSKCAVTACGTCQLLMRPCPTCVSVDFLWLMPQDLRLWPRGKFLPKALNQGGAVGPPGNLPTGQRLCQLPQNPGHVGLGLSGAQPCRLLGSPPLPRTLFLA